MSSRIYRHCGNAFVAAALQVRLAGLKACSYVLSVLILSAPASAQGVDPSALLQPPSDSWLTYHGDYSGRHHSRLTQITPDNVGQLALAWAFQTGQTQQIKATPIVAGGVIYVTTPDNLWAIDARNGRQIWRYAYPMNDGFHIGHRGAAVSKGLVFLTTPDAHLIALDARDGTVKWDTVIADAKKGYWSTNAPLLIRNHLIVGVSASIEPTYQNLYVKSNLSGEFTVVNEFLVRELKKLNLWDEVMIADLKYFDGSLSKIDRIPPDVRSLYATAFEIEPQWLVECAARRQKWVDQSQSLNIYMAGASGKKLDDTYKLAWLRGLKTTYYLRTLGATSTEKSTGRAGQLNAVTASGGAAMAADELAQPKFCAIDDPECEACQ